MKSSETYVVDRRSETRTLLIDWHTPFWIRYLSNYNDWSIIFTHVYIYKNRNAFTKAMEPSCGVGKSIDRFSSVIHMIILWKMIKNDLITKFFFMFSVPEER